MGNNISDSDQYIHLISILVFGQKFYFIMRKEVPNRNNINFRVKIKSLVDCSPVIDKTRILDDGEQIY